MRSIYPLLGVFSAVLASACAPQVASTTVTSASIPPAAAAPAPAAPAAKEAAAPAEAPPGTLVCRTKSADGTSELYLEWNGAEAKGVLRTVAPSGMVEQKNLHAERANGKIVADDTLSTDLAVHAATVREVNGKTYMRLGEWTQAWSACE